MLERISIISGSFLGPPFFWFNCFACRCTQHHPWFLRIGTPFGTTSKFDRIFVKALSKGWCISTLEEPVGINIEAQLEPCHECHPIWNLARQPIHEAMDLLKIHPGGHCIWQLPRQYVVVEVEIPETRHAACCCNGQSLDNADTWNHDKMSKYRDRKKKKHDNQSARISTPFFSAGKSGNFLHVWADFLTNYTENLERKGKITGENFPPNIQWRRHPEIADFCPLSWPNVS